MRCSKLALVSVIVFLSLTILVSLRAKTQAASTIISGSDFDIYLVDSSIVFQTYFDVEFQCVGGVWNGTNSTLSVQLDKGSISFIPVDNCTLNILAYDTDRTFNVQASRATLTKNEGNYSAVVTSGPRVTITWRFLPWSVVDNYFMIGVGLTGIVLLIAGPTWLARTFIKHGLDVETVEHVGYMMLLMVMGFGFTVVWLWA